MFSLHILRLCHDVADIPMKRMIEEALGWEVTGIRRVLQPAVDLLALKQRQMRIFGERTFGIPQLWCDIEIRLPFPAPSTRGYCVLLWDRSKWWERDHLVHAWFPIVASPTSAPDEALVTYSIELPSYSPRRHVIPEEGIQMYRHYTRHSLKHFHSSPLLIEFFQIGPDEWGLYKDIARASGKFSDLCLTFSKIHQK